MCILYLELFDNNGSSTKGNKENKIKKKMSIIMWISNPVETLFGNSMFIVFFTKVISSLVRYIITDHVRSRSTREGNVFRGVCPSVHRGWTGRVHHALILPGDGQGVFESDPAWGRCWDVIWQVTYPPPHLPAKAKFFLLLSLNLYDQ